MFMKAPCGCVLQVTMLPEPADPLLIVVSTCDGDGSPPFIPADDYYTVEEFLPTDDVKEAVATMRLLLVEGEKFRSVVRPFLLLTPDSG